MAKPSILVFPMVSELERQCPAASNFSVSAPTSSIVFFRTYSRFNRKSLENWQQIYSRTESIALSRGSVQ
jgi:hypothetical protein